MKKWNSKEVLPKRDKKYKGVSVQVLVYDFTYREYAIGFYAFGSKEWNFEPDLVSDKFEWRKLPKYKRAK